jgi:hypothetical protein
VHEVDTYENLLPFVVHLNSSTGRLAAVKFIQFFLSLLLLALWPYTYRLCGLVVRVPGYRSRDPALIPGALRLSEK